MVGAVHSVLIYLFVLAVNNTLSHVPDIILVANVEVISFHQGTHTSVSVCGNGIN